MVSSVLVCLCHRGAKDKVLNGGDRHTVKMEDSPKEEDNLKIEDNLKKRMTKYVDNPEKENDPKHFARGGEGGAL